MVALETALDHSQYQETLRVVGTAMLGCSTFQHHLGTWQVGATVLLQLGWVTTEAIRTARVWPCDCIVDFAGGRLHTP